LWGIGHVPVALRVNLPGAYDLGFTPAPDGTWTLVCDGAFIYDPVQGKPTEACRWLGPDAAWLRQEYLAQAAGAHARRDAFTETRAPQPDGSLILTYRR
jgi:hypothetical protein